MDREILAEMVATMIRGGWITYDDVISIIKKGTSQMLGDSEDKIFKK